jgi:hypothetical protein
LAPSDFYFFVAIKWKLAGSESGSATEFTCEVTGVTNFISYFTLAKVFGEWEQWLQKCIDREGDYVD